MKKMKEKEKSEEKPLLKRKRNKIKSEEQNSTNTSRETQKRSFSLSKNTKKPNRKRLLKNKLEFFLSDINLYHDKYLKKVYLSHNESISPETFLTFNSIKVLLSDIDKTENKKNVIIKAVEISNKLKYDKITNKIKRVMPFKEKLINIDLYDKCTVYVENLPPIVTHNTIYDIFQDYKILYISLIKGKGNKLTGQAFITFKSIEDIPLIIEKYNNCVPKQISLLNPKELKPLKIMTKENYIKNYIPENIKTNNNLNNSNIITNSNNNNNNSVNNSQKNQIKKNNNLEENTCVKIYNIKNNITLDKIKKCLSNIVLPLFIDINRNDNTIILRFESKKESDIFLDKFKNNNYEDIKDIINYECEVEKKNEIKSKYVEELNDEDRKKYLDFVKKEIEIFKEKKENRKKEKNKKLNEKKGGDDFESPDFDKKILKSFGTNEKCDSDIKNILKDLNNDEMKIENNNKNNKEDENKINDGEDNVDLMKDKEEEK